MVEPLSRLTQLSVSFISLVRTPATGKGLTLKSDGRAQTIRIVKADDERMMAYGIVYAPDEVDSHGDTADSATIRRAAYEFMREGRAKNVDREHSFAPETHYVAESWLLRAGDPMFPDEPEGAWAVGIQIGDPDVWADLKSGALTGISLAGIARVDPATPAPPATQWTEKDNAGLVAWLKGLFAKSQDTKDPNQKEPDMDEAKVKEIVRATLKDELTPALTVALKAAGLGSGQTQSGEAQSGQTPPTQTAPPVDPQGVAKSAPPASAPASNDEIAALKTAVAALEDKLAIKTAKGATEVGGGITQNEESFL